jgi:LacI family transcriptional regulator, galactose operon repressor
MSSITMSDVANELGVSRASVSYALNGLARERGVSRQLEKRILHVAQEMGYRPSRLAQSLVRRRSNTIGLILPDMGASYGPTLTESLETAARANGYQVLLSHHGNDLGRFRETIQTMLGWQVDGLVIVPLTGSDQQEVLKDLENLPVPATVVERDIGSGRSHVITCDAEVAMRMAAEHLLELGHKRIGLIDGARELLESQVREDSYRATLRRAGIEFDPALLFAPSLTGTPQQDAAMVDQMLDMPERPTAVIVVSGNRAISLYRACVKRGLSIPGDLSVVAVTGMTFDDFSKVQFTSARLTYGEVGKAAFQLLQNDIENGRTPPRRVLTSPQWIAGQSTAPLRDK